MRNLEKQVQEARKQVDEKVHLKACILFLSLGISPSIKGR